MSFQDLLSSGILLTCFMLVASKRIQSYINIIRLQSILLSLLAFGVGYQDVVRKGSYDVLMVCLVIVVVKVFVIPSILDRTYHQVKYAVEKDFFYNIPSLVLTCFLMVMAAYFSISSIPGISTGSVSMYIVNALSVVLIGLFFMISRKKAIGQIVGFLVLENGIFLTALLSTGGMPFAVDVGVFADLLTAVLMMGLLTFRISDKFDSIDTDKLKNLRG